MESFYLAIALLTAGVSLLSGILHLMSGLARDGEKSELTFGIISLSVFIFLVLPPTGFILGDRVPYSLAIDIKRIFIWTYYGTLPWFIEYYSGYKKRPLTYAVEIFLAASYVVMLFTHEGRTVWFWLSRAALGIILYYGVVAGIKMLHTHQHKEAKWLLATMVIYGALLLLSTINQIGNNFLGRMMGTKTFFPIHLNMLAFIVLMSIRLRTNAQEKFRLQKALSWGDTRWNMLVNNMHLMILELDTGGVVRYANPYAVKKLGYHSEADLLGKNWFECFALSDEAPVLKNLYLESVEEQKLLTHFTSRVRISAEKRLVVNWTNVFLYNRDDSVRGIMTIGIDNTERENAFELVQQLKNELEKENLLLKGQPAPATDNADIIGQSDAILYAIQKAKQVAVTNAGVLLLGETGTGKEQFANLIHRNSYRINKPLVKVNCAALPAELIESELFGHEKGSFTGAATARKGKFELADGGTLFL
ncbi:MAG TPA: sigma 54-interacting transcriptional regulator, partial [Puia sp.]|nr:sigma 54-interacting transcriptional regulator [Puia sp.]